MRAASLSCPASWGSLTISDTVQSGGVEGELPAGRGLVVCVICLEGGFVCFSPVTVLSSILYLGGIVKSKDDNVRSKYFLFRRAEVEALVR